MVSGFYQKSICGASFIIFPTISTKSTLKIGLQRSQCARYSLLHVDDAGNSVLVGLADDDHNMIRAAAGRGARPVMNPYTLIRRMPKRAIIALLQFLVFIAPTAAYEIGESPRDRIGFASTGEEVFLSQGHGRIQIVTFWATWCAPCRKELPVLGSIQQQAGGDRLRVLAVNLKEDRGVYRKAVKAMSEFGLTFIHDKRGATANYFDVEGIPHMLILDADGVVVHKHVGYSEEEVYKIVAELNALLRENRAAAPPDE